MLLLLALKSFFMSCVYLQLYSTESEVQDLEAVR